MRPLLTFSLLALLNGYALTCEYKEKKSPCCDDGFAESNDVYLFTYYAWAVNSLLWPIFS